MDVVVSHLPVGWPTGLLENVDGEKTLRQKTTSFFAALLYRQDKKKDDDAATTHTYINTLSMTDDLNNVISSKHCAPQFFVYIISLD